MARKSKIPYLLSKTGLPCSILEPKFWQRNIVWGAFANREAVSETSDLVCISSMSSQLAKAPHCKSFQCNFYLLGQCLQDLYHVGNSPLFIAVCIYPIGFKCPNYPLIIQKPIQRVSQPDASDSLLHRTIWKGVPSICLEKSRNFQKSTWQVWQFL